MALGRIRAGPRAGLVAWRSASKNVSGRDLDFDFAFLKWGECISYRYSLVRDRK
jgi:hypothetical protein